MDQKALERIAQGYRDEGYDVIVHPHGDQVPPFVQDWRQDGSIDLIARRGNGGAVVEIKTRRSDLHGDPQLARMADIINAQPGWRLDLVVLEPESAIERATQGALEPSDEQLAQILDTAEELLDSDYAPYACVVAWGGLEAAMRRIRDRAPASRPIAPTELMNTLYGDGFLSPDQLVRLRESYKIRTQIAHGFATPKIDSETVRFVTATARRLANDALAVVPSNGASHGGTSSLTTP